ncbi:MAG: hypothetical protein ACRDQ5_20000, partial [Sciscionella sp.]
MADSRTAVDGATAVPVRLGTSRPETIVVTVASTTGRSTVSAGKQAVKRRGSVTIRVSRDRPGVVWVAPLASGRPLEPGDRLAVHTPHGEFQVDVWIEPVTGQWQPTNNLGIVAVHAALMRKRSAGEVVMWSPPR